MPNDKELVTALERAVAKLRQRRQISDETEGFAIEHNLCAANLILGTYSKHQELFQVQRKLAETIIDRANQKERIKL